MGKIFPYLSIVLLIMVAGGAAHAQDSKSDSLRSSVHLVVGKMAKKCGFSEFAEKEFEKAVSLNSESLDASNELEKLCLLRSDAATQHGNYALAERELGKAIALNKSNYEAEYELANVYAALSAKSENEDERLMYAKRASDISTRILAAKASEKKSESESQKNSPAVNLAKTPTPIKAGMRAVPNIETVGLAKPESVAFSAQSLRSGESMSISENNTDMFGRPAGTYERSVEKTAKETEERLFKHPWTVRTQKRPKRRSSSASGGKPGAVTYSHVDSTGISREITRAQYLAQEKSDYENYVNKSIPVQREG